MKNLMPALALLLAAPAFAAAPPSYGILLMAHGGDASWNSDIAVLRDTVDSTIPTETALGMADVKELQAAVDRLEKRGVKSIAAVPLFIHTRSEVLDQTRYALGLADKPSEVLRAAFARIASKHAGHGEHAAHAVHAAPSKAPAGHAHAFSTERVKAAIPLAMTPALDEHPFVARILLERAKALSRKPKLETVILVAHGPVDDAAQPAWEASLASLAARVRKEGGFKAAVFGMLRDDAVPEVRAAAVADLRSKVSAAGIGGEGRALVVPVLIARGGIEEKIAKDLAGLDYAWDGKTLMPHAGFDSWVLDRAATAGEKAP
jgi:sirohydrochlorin ferrochelatase